MDSASPDGSITRLIAEIKAGNRDAVTPLWEGYFTRLVSLARVRLRTISRAVVDEEDVALSAFNSFCIGVEKGRFPRLDDRHDLWQILFLLTSRKATGQIRSETRDKRDFRRRVQGPATGGSPDSAPDVLATAASPDPSPEFAAEVSEACKRLLDLLGDESQLRQVAIMKMEGFTNEEIARMIGRSTSTVERKLSSIRELWIREIGTEME